MLDIQTLLVFILAIITVCLVTVSVYVIITMKEFRETLRKADGAFENIEDITDSMASPANTVVSLISAVSEAVKAVRSVRSITDFSDEED